jgi:hypothetical protein
MTEKQKLAHARNWFKFRLIGMMPHPVAEILTPKEKVLYKRLVETHKALVDGFNLNSTKLGLKVQPRCFCGRVGKFPNPYDNTLVVCKTHAND